MIYTIVKDRHYSTPPTPKLLLPVRTYLTRRFMFENSCRYDLRSEDQLDINKLWGIGYFPSHHRNSVRFGWRYDLPSEKMEIFAYWYMSGVRGWESMGLVDLCQEYDYTILAQNDAHTLLLQQGATTFRKVSIPLKRRFVGYELRPYFGGNRTAPHTMEILS